MNQWSAGLQTVWPYVGSLLAVAVAALSAPVTANRFRLAKLERLTATLDKLDENDPARPYIAAEVRKRAAWYAATTTVRLSIIQIGTLILFAWITATLVGSLLWPSPYDFPFMWWWSKVLALVAAVWTIAETLRLRRLERVNLHNLLIDAGPTEFTELLRKRAFVPRLGTNVPTSPTPALRRPDATKAGHLLEREGVVTCPKGHPVNGRNLFITEYDHEQKPPRQLLCARCLEPLPTPSTRDLDELERAVEARVEMLRRKRAKREVKKKSNDSATSTAGPENQEDQPT